MSFKATPGTYRSLRQRAEQMARPANLMPPPAYDAQAGVPVALAGGEAHDVARAAAPVTGPRPVEKLAPFKLETGGR